MGGSDSCVSKPWNPQNYALLKKIPLYGVCVCCRAPKNKWCVTDTSMLQNNVVYMVRRLVNWRSSVIRTLISLEEDACYYVCIVHVQVVSRGNDQVAISSRFETRADAGI